MNLLSQNHARYLNDHDFLGILGKSGICILSDFIRNARGIDAFWDTYYPKGAPRTVICGINPGRFGAGQTGIPFIDFHSLQQLLPGVKRQDQEKSAGFFFRVVEAFGAREFFRNFYVTNVSAVGFLREGRNLNYPDLPGAALQVVKRRFLEEMEAVQPTRIVSLGRHVQETMRKLTPGNADCSGYLPHPAWIATYRAGEIELWVDRYVQTLKNHCEGAIRP